MLKIKIKQEDKREYKKYLSSRGFFGAVKIIFVHIFYMVKEYIKLPKKEKEKAFIEIYYNAVDIPILTIGLE